MDIDKDEQGCTESRNCSVEIADGIYWVGDDDPSQGLNCNPYLLIDEGEAVLFDPGSILDYEQVIRNVQSFIPLHKIKYVVLHHQDPDFCSAVPLLEKMGMKFTVVTHWRTMTLISFYGIRSEYYLVNENSNQLMLSSGRLLRFVPTPYLHFPGAITTYDTKSRILFSSDLFGAFSYNHSFYAGEDYIEKMMAFHEHYMPSNDIIRPVMEIFLGMDISMIAPQHGSIIKSSVREYIIALRELECGSLLAPIKKDLMQSGGYRLVFNTVLRRFASVFEPAAVVETFQAAGMTVSPENLEVLDYNLTGETMWQKLFSVILKRQGIRWLVVIEPLVRKICSQYGILLPEAVASLLKTAEEASDALSQENARLQELNDRLNSSVRETQEKLIKCPITNLYNEPFFKNYIRSELKNIELDDRFHRPALLMISIDKGYDIRFDYGEDEYENILKNITYIIRSLLKESQLVFRMETADFSCYLPDISYQGAIELAEKIRNDIFQSEKFITRISVSIGVASLDGLSDDVKKEIGEEVAESLEKKAISRLRIAKKMGMNSVCGRMKEENNYENDEKVLLVDTDPVNINVIRSFLENEGITVLEANNGEMALQLAERENPRLILSEVMLPKIDGFLLREKLKMSSLTQKIDFLLMSHLKDENAVKRALSLGILHFFRKPFMLSEVVGIIKNRLRGEDVQ